MCVCGGEGAWHCMGGLVSLFVCACVCGWVTLNVYVCLCGCVGVCLSVDYTQGEAERESKRERGVIESAGCVCVPDAIKTCYNCSSFLVQDVIRAASGLA